MAYDVGVFFRLVIAAFATWRLAFLVAREEGPWGVFGRVRRFVGLRVPGGLFTCVKCVSMWIAMPFAVFVHCAWPEVIVVWLALAGVSALIDEVTRQPFEWRDVGETQVPDQRGRDES